jgi:REP-associated tyrosine transposase
MPRTARSFVGGMCYHVLNRGNARQEVFHKEGDFATFLDLMAAATRRVPLRVLGFVLMPNHFHFVLWPDGDGDLSRWMQWLLTSHVRRYHLHHEGTGHVWQGRFKAFPIDQDEHLWRVLRYVERNPVRAGLANRAEAWPWSSLSWRSGGRRPEVLSDWPIACPPGWVQMVNAAETEAELAALRRSVALDVRFGTKVDK